MQDKETFAKETTQAQADIKNVMRDFSEKQSSFAFENQNSCVASAGNTQVNNNDLFLEIDLSGYGSLKPTWKTFLIATGFAEGVVQGSIVSIATNNTWLGVAVAVEEFISEYLTWNGVDWILGETFAPVTLDATLTQPSNQELLWHASSFVTSNDDELKKYDKEKRKDKSIQLQASLHEAEQKLLVSLNDYLTHKYRGESDVESRFPASL